jgi:hypothetical protein
MNAGPNTADWIQAFSAVTGLVLAGALIGVTWRYVRLTNRIARSTEASGFLRSIPLVVGVDFPSDSEDSRFMFRCRNVGNAPALNLHLQLKIGAQTYGPLDNVYQRPNQPPLWEVLAGSDRVMAPEDEVVVAVDIVDPFLQNAQEQAEIIATYWDIARRQFEVTSLPGRDTALRYRLSLTNEWTFLKGKDWGDLAPPPVKTRPRWLDLLSRARATLSKSRNKELNS